MLCQGLQPVSHCRKKRINEGEPEMTCPRPAQTVEVASSSPTQQIELPQRQRVSANLKPQVRIGTNNGGRHDRVQQEEDERAVMMATTKATRSIVSSELSTRFGACAYRYPVSFR
jgi:hypothetical protein